MQSGESSSSSPCSTPPISHSSRSSSFSDGHITVRPGRGGSPKSIEVVITPGSLLQRRQPTVGASAVGQRDQIPFASAYQEKWPALNDSQANLYRKETSRVRDIPIAHFKTGDDLPPSYNFTSPDLITRGSANSVMDRNVNMPHSQTSVPNIGMNQAGMHSTTINVQVPKPPGAPIAHKPGSNYSSPRSSIGSYDSKSSSPRTSMVNPPSYDFQRHSSPHSSALSLRSGVSNTSQDSKHSSPRGSLTRGQTVNIMFEKYPKGVSVATSGRSIIMTDHSGVDQSGHSITIPSRGPTMSLMDRFNESAPPPPYEQSRVRSAVHISHSGAHHAVPPNIPTGPQYRITRHTQLHQSKEEPHTINAQHSTLLKTGSITSGSPIYQNLPGRERAGSPVVNKIRGLHYDVVPPRSDGPSEAEKKLAALTLQLENEMGVSGIKKLAADRDKTEPPPPYHGPHITGTQMSNFVNVVPKYNVSPSGHSGTPSPNSTLSTASSKQSYQSTPVAASMLPVHITPPQPKGPTDVEKKLEALTLDLESQFEQHPQGDYYGKLPVIAPSSYMHKISFSHVGD